MIDSADLPGRNHVQTAQQYAMAVERSNDVSTGIGIQPILIAVAPVAGVDVCHAARHDTTSDPCRQRRRSPCWSGSSRLRFQEPDGAWLSGASTFVDVPLVRRHHRSALAHDRAAFSIGLI